MAKHKAGKNKEAGMLPKASVPKVEVKDIPHFKDKKSADHTVNYASGRNK